VTTGTPAVTIEPAARAVGAEFHPLETHDAELWVAVEWSRDRVVGEALDLLSGRRFQRRLAAIGGYDLAGCGTRVA
jgi:molybdate-binding protein